MSVTAISICTLSTFDCSTESSESWNEHPKVETRFRKYLKPVAASMVAALGSMVVGTLNGYPSPAIPNINSHRNPFRVSADEQSWFGSLVFLSGIPGAFFSGWIMDTYGRKFSLMMGSLPFVVGWTVIAGASNVAMLYVGRLLTGFCFALMLSIVSVYISEIAPAEIRGLLMSFHELAINIGVLLAYVIGAYVPWNWLAILCASISCLQVVLLLFLPETPRWLVLNGRKDAAVEALIWLRGHDSSYEEEIAAIQRSVTETRKLVPWADYVKPPLLKCLIVSQFLFVVQELSGINVVRFYTVSIFQASGSELDSNVETIIVGAVLVIGSCVCTSLIDRFERRILMMVSSVTMGVSMAAMGAFFKVKESDEHFALASLGWLPLLSMVAVTVGYVLGCGPLPYVVTSELFSTRARGRASSLGVATLCLFGFLITKLFVNVTYAIGQAGAFWLCSGICFAGFVIIYWMMPETKGKTLENIQQNLGQ